MLELFDQRFGQCHYLKHGRKFIVLVGKSYQPMPPEVKSDFRQQLSKYVVVRAAAVE